MRIFGNILQTFRLSRRLSCSSTNCRYTSTVLTDLNKGHLTNPRHVENCVAIRLLGSKSGNSQFYTPSSGDPPSRSCDQSGKLDASTTAAATFNDICNIMPVALINSNNNNNSESTKILLIPINLFQNDGDAVQKTASTLLALHENARQIEAFTANLAEFSSSTLPLSNLQLVAEPESQLSELEAKDDAAFWQKNEEITAKDQDNQQAALYDPLDQASADKEDNHNANDSFDVVAWNDSKRCLFAQVPETLQEKLKHMAISSVQLAFEMDMTNIRDAIMLGSKTRDMDMLKAPQSDSLRDPILALTTCLHMDSTQQKHTVPLNFHALIQGTIEIDPSKLSPEQIREIKVPEFNDSVTTIAANICSTALQKGFPADIGRKSFSTQSTSAANDKGQRNPHIVCVRDSKQGCVSPGNANLPIFKPSSGSGDSDKKTSKKSKKADGCSDTPLLSSSATIGDCGGRGLMSCQAYKQALEEAAKRREALKESTKSKCKPKKKKALPCGDNKAVNPAMEAKKKKKDKSGWDPCKEKEDPCQKNEEPCEPRKKNHKAPCNKDKCKKKDPCKSKINSPCHSDKGKTGKHKGGKGAKKASACNSPEQKANASIECNPPGPCSAKKDKADSCGDKKDFSTKLNKPKCDSNKSDSKTNAPPKKSTSKSSCGSTKKSDSNSKCGSAKKSICSSPKKSDSKSKCGAPKKRASKASCGPPKKSDSKSKCGAPKKSASESAKNSDSELKCEEVKMSDAKLSQMAKKNADYKSRCKLPNKFASNSSSGSSDSKSKCGSPKKTDSKSKCEAPKKSDSKSSCGSPKKSDSKSMCEPQKKSDSKSSSGSPKESDSKSKCEAPKKSDSKSSCGSPKKSDSKAKHEAPKESDSKSSCGSPKKSDSKSKAASPKKNQKPPCNKPEKKPNASIECNTADPCFAKKDKECGASKESDSKSKCGPPKNASSNSKSSSGSPEKSDSKSKCESPKKGDSKSSCGSPKKSDSKSKCGSPKKSDSKSNCGSTKESDPKSKDPKTSDSKSKCGSPKKSDSKSECGPPKKSDSKSSCGSKKADDSKPKCTPKKSEGKCTSSTKTICPNSDVKEEVSTKPSCGNGDKKGDKGKGGNNPCKKSFSTAAITSKSQELHNSLKTAVILPPVKRNFSTTSVNLARLFSTSQIVYKKESDCRGVKIPGSRKNIHRRNKLKNCFSNYECVKERCKYPIKIACNKDSKKEGRRDKDKKKGKGKEENKHSLGSYFNTSSGISYYGASCVLKRMFGTIVALRTRINCNDPCNIDVSDKQSDKDEQANEIIKISEAGKIDIICENLPNISDYDVLIRTEAVAISGSDIHIYETGGKSSPGVTLGHDAAGVIEKIGRCIYNLKPGDRVAVESGLSCGICDFCKRGLYNLCSQLIFNGFLSKYQVHPADLCHKIPNSVTMEEATLTQTLAMGCQACLKAHITPITNVLVIGSGPTAVAAALSARAFGARKVCMSSTMHYTLESIRRAFDFEFAIYDDCCIQHTETLESIFYTLNDWPDVVINCAISENTMNLSVMALQVCGTCVLAECDMECACFNAMDVLMKNLKMVPSFRSTNMFPTAVHLMQSGQAPIGGMIARTYKWQDIDGAFRAALHESNTGYKKIIVKCAEEGNCGEYEKS